MPGRDIRAIYERQGEHPDLISGLCPKTRESPSVLIVLGDLGRSLERDPGNPIEAVEESKVKTMLSGLDISLNLLSRIFNLELAPH